MDESSFLMYQTEDGETKIDVRIEDETVWMTQKAMVELYQSSKQNISLHIKNIIKEGELKEDSVVKYYLTTASDDKQYQTIHYNLEMILAVGYRVRSHRGTQFRIWATERLSEYLVKGFVMDDERLKDVQNLGNDYFNELLKRIRDIRTSEKRFYKQITDIYATSVDYDRNVPMTREFFATVQNKLHFAIHGYTAAELIRLRADASKDNMGLSTWKGDKVRKEDITVAKNYLTDTELEDLNQIVTMYLDYAELQAKGRKAMYMKDWTDKLDAFLQFNEQDILRNAGKVSRKVAGELAKEEYDRFQKKRLENPEKDDFDEFIERNQFK